MAKRDLSSRRPLGVTDDIDAGDAVLEAIGFRLRETRIAQGMSGKELAEKVGCSSSFIYDLEGGIANFTYQMLRRVCDALAVDFRRVLIEGDEHHHQQKVAELLALSDEVSQKITALRRLSADLDQIVTETSALNAESRALLQSEAVPSSSLPSASKPN